MYLEFYVGVESISSKKINFSKSKIISINFRPSVVRALPGGRKTRQPRRSLPRSRSRLSGHEMEVNSATKVSRKVEESSRTIRVSVHSRAWLRICLNNEKLNDKLDTSDDTRLGQTVSQNISRRSSFCCLFQWPRSLSSSVNYLWFAKVILFNLISWAGEHGRLWEMKAHICPSGKLLSLWTYKTIQCLKGKNQICLTLGQIQAFTSFD